jgi:hypothetical protein
VNGTSNPKQRWKTLIRLELKRRASRMPVKTVVTALREGTNAGTLAHSVLIKHGNPNLN